MGWYPSFLAPILAATLLASLPSALPFKGGLALIVIQAAGAFAAFALSALLGKTPIVLFGAIGLILFVSFAVIASGRAFFPTLLVLICFSTIPIVAIDSPEHAGELPKALIRGMAIAVTAIWLAHAIWPRPVGEQSAASSAPTVVPLSLALAGTAIVLPLMLVFLMWGLTDALPVLITTVVLVVNFDPSRGATQGAAMILGNFIGGMIAILCHAVLDIAPSLFALGCIALLLGLFFGVRIARGGPAASVALITFNQAVIMLSLGLLPGPSSTGIWVTRLLQFAVASAFAVGMMSFLLPRVAHGLKRVGEEKALSS